MGQSFTPQKKVEGYPLFLSMDSPVACAAAHPFPFVNAAEAASEIQATICVPNYTQLISVVVVAR